MAVWTWTGGGRLCLCWVLTALLGVASGPTLAQAPAQTASAFTPPVYTVSVVPQFQAVDLHRTWTPVLERLSKQLGVSFTLQIAKDIPTFEDDLRVGQPDLAYLNPYHEVMARRAQGYVPLVRDRKPLTGILVVRRDDPISSVQALRGKVLAFPAPNAFGASLLVRAHLAEAEKIDIVPLYARTHSNAYRQTLTGMSAASGGLRATLEKEPEEVRQSLRVLLETPGSAPHPLAAHPRVPVKLRQALTQALLDMAKDPQDKALLDAILMGEPMRADYRRDYLPIERLLLEKYAQ